VGQSVAIDGAAYDDELAHDGRGLSRSTAEPKRAAGGLATSERRAHRLIDSNVIGVVFAVGERLMEANDAFLCTIGCSRADLEAGRLSWRDITPPEYRDLDDRCLAELERRGECAPFEKEYWRKDGTRVPVLVGVALVNHSPMECVAFVLDLSVRKRLEEEYRASEARFHTLARLAPIGIFRRDVGGGYQYVNDAWCAITGVAPKQALGSGWIPRLHLDDRDRIRAQWERAVAAEAPLALEYRIKHPDRGTIWLCERAVVERDGARRTVGYVGTITDVTDRKQVEEERQRLFLAAVEANRVKDDFLATVAHELRSPLSSIVLWTGLLRRGNLDVEGGARAVDAIERNTRLLSRLVEDLLDVARIASGKLSVQLTRVDLHSIVAAAVEAARPATKAKHLQLEVQLDRQKMSVHGDVVRLHQILNNLLTNAIKFTTDGGRIAVELAKDGSAARITVSDTGRGIAPDFLPRVFERFHQADPASGQPQDGLGLGLGIVRCLVERHGGKIAAASPGLGQGATFSVMIPLSPEERPR
jgi:PAS domain S-box-containing protein